MGKKRRPLHLRITRLTSGQRWPEFPAMGMRSSIIHKQLDNTNALVICWLEEADEDA